MERYEFSEREKQLLQALSEEKTAAELMQAFSMEELHAYLSQMRERGLVSYTFTISGLLFAQLTNTGSVYLKENPNLDPPLKTEVEHLQKKNLQLDIELNEANRKLRSWKRLAVILGVLGTIIGGVLGALGIIENVRHLFLGG